MVEGGDGGGAEQATGLKPMSSYESSGGRQRFTVELRPGETTIVSWKKLLRDTTSSHSNGLGSSASRPFPETQQQHIPNPPLPPPTEANSKQLPESRPKDSENPSETNRLATVIEKIERLYAGNSSEEEDVFLNGVPDDDEYDTEDSFIDDAKLDDYFKVDNSAIKHDGFFVNRGKLERIEPTVPSNPQPKKRRHKDATIGEGGGGDEHNRNKQGKIGNNRKPSSLIERNSTTQSHRLTAPNKRSADLISEASPVSDVPLKKKTTAAHVTFDPSGQLHGEGIKKDKGAGQQRNHIPSSQNHNNKQKESNEFSDTSVQRHRNSHVSMPHSGKQLNHTDEPDQTIRQNEKSGFVERFDLNVPASRHCMQITKVPLMRKEGSNVRLKTSLLEKAFRELEKIVSECRPPSTEVRESDNTSQGITKRRLSTDIRMKIARVARLSLDNYGKVPKDVINRLMSIVGHLMQLRSLKRNLNLMAGLGVTARREKDDRMQTIKQEVQEMVRQRIPYIKSKMEQQTTNFDDFQEAGPEEKEALQRKYSPDDALENKLCELYNVYVERLEEFSGPPVKWLYEELVALWPSGAMDIAGIKSAICKARERKRAIKDQERIRKKVSVPRPADSVQGKAVNVNLSVVVNEKASSEGGIVFPSMSRPMQSASAPQATSHLPIPLANVPNVDKHKQETVKGSNSSDATATQTDALPRKRVKKKLNPEMVIKADLEKLVVPQIDEKHKHHTNPVVSLPQLNITPDAPIGIENPN